MTSEGTVDAGGSTRPLPAGRWLMVVAWGVGACVVQVLVPLLGAPFGIVVGIVGLWVARGELRAIDRGTGDGSVRGRVIFGLTLSAIGAAVGVLQVIAFFVGLLLFTQQVLSFLGWLFSFWPTVGCAPPIL